MSITAELDLTIPSSMRLPEHGIHDRLNPMELSHEESVFLLKHLEERPAKALAGYDKSIPHNPEPEHGIKQSINPWWIANPGVHPKVVERLLSRIRDIEDTEPERLGYYRRDTRMAPLLGKKPGEEYFGLDAIRESIQDAMEYNRRLNEIRKREPGAALHPSMHTIDGRGRLHWQGVGSDRGMVRRFTCELYHDVKRSVAPEWMSAAAHATDILTDDKQGQKMEGPGANYQLIEGPNFFECPVKGCNRRFNFRQDNDASRNKAYSNMRNHMAAIKTQVDDHREAKLVIYG